MPCSQQYRLNEEADKMLHPRLLHLTIRRDLKFVHFTCEVSSADTPNDEANDKERRWRSNIIPLV